MNVLVDKFKEVILAVLPITMIVLILNFTIAPIGWELIVKFIIGALFIILGLAIFLFGTDIGIQPMGSLMGASLTKTKKIWIIVIFGFIIGFMISVAEPDLQVLARQVSIVTSGALSHMGLVVVISIGVGLMIALGLLRVIFDISLSNILTIIYGIIFSLAIFSSSGIIAISFDAGGATTGSMTVPFILALGLGVSSVKGGKGSEDDSFGLVALASAGPMLAVPLMSLISKTKTLTGNLPYNSAINSSLIYPFIHELGKAMLEVTIALAPLLILFLLFQKFLLKISRRRLNRILKGALYTFIGLVLFLTGVNAGFMEAGSAIGHAVASYKIHWMVIPIGFLLGFTVIFAEPAVHVLTEQVEEVTGGHLTKKIILSTLCIGVAFAVALAMLRILSPKIYLWHYLLPGYMLAIIMSHFAPKIFVGIAFDSGGVASGPMTATFILAFAQGVANAIEGADILNDAFGVIAMVALAPLIAIQTLGLIYKYKASKVRS